mmetsp:Transcript_1158/g.2475  ORF Transcript_1158/g.2475 Transcript_1158/m.2475 type:complete len:280 (-) Transcript_1158:397-1236(-)
MHAEHRHELANLILLLLKDTLGDPDEVPDLLLLQLHICVEDRKVHLPLEGQLEHLDVTLIESVVNGFVAGGDVDVPEPRVLGEELEDTPELVLVRDVSEHGGASGVEVSGGGVEALAVRRAHGGLVEGCPEGVEGDVDGIGVRPDAEELAHDLGGRSSEALDEGAEVLDPVLDEGGLDDLDLDLLEDVADLITAFGGLLEELGEVGADGSVDEDGLVEVLVAPGVGLEGGDGPHGRLLEHAKGVALGNELIDVASRKGSLQQKHHVVGGVPAHLFGSCT